MKKILEFLSNLIEKVLTSFVGEEHVGQPDVTLTDTEPSDFEKKQEVVDHPEAEVEVVQEKKKGGKKKTAVDNISASDD